MKIHPLADVQSSQIGEGTTIWQFSVVLTGAVIGKNCNINCHTFIENDVVIGDNVTIKSGTFVWDSIRIENDVFVGPNVVFTNDLRPRSKHYVEYPVTNIRQGASIGANTTVLAGVTVGAYAMTGIGSVVTRDVPDHALVYGNPARVKGWVDKKGRKLRQVDAKTWESVDGEKYLINNSIVKAI
ncbi:MAG: N-acetyltransferase [Chitinophagaceae bacterium]|nr:MAG: N-acetyltransferase [Chitinophagaceae bacterium]